MDHDQEASGRGKGLGSMLAHFPIRSFDREQRSAEFICSTDAIDSYGERVEQKWILDRYLKNPVVLYGHNSRELPIGRAHNVRIEGGNLCATISLLSKEANPLSENILAQWAEGSLNTVSVGFMPRSHRWEKTNDVETLVLSDNELMEISVVPVPANPEALAKMRARALEMKADEAGKSPMENEIKASLAKREAELAEKSAALSVAEKALDAEKARTKSLEAEAVRLAGERDAEKARADKAEGAEVERSIDSVVADDDLKADLRALAKSDRAMFERQIKRCTPASALTQKQISSDPAGGGAIAPDYNPFGEHASLAGARRQQHGNSRMHRPDQGDDPLVHGQGRVGGHRVQGGQVQHFGRNPGARLHRW